MNKIFKVIWSKSKQCYIVVSEIAKNKTGKKKIVVASILAALTMTANIVTVEGAIPEGTTKDSLGIAIGIYSKSESNQSVAIGYASSAQAPNSNPENPATAVGAGANANGRGAVALGLSANANGENAIALGGGANSGKYKTEATAKNSIALGFDAKASGVGATAIGLEASSTATDAIAMGRSANATGGTSISLGYNTNSSATNTVAIGSSVSATAESAIALGRSTTASGISATAIGPLAVASGSTSAAFGLQAKAGGQDSLAIGNNVNASGRSSFAGGLNSAAAGTGALALGDTAKANSDRTIAIGPSAIANDANSVAIGTRDTTANKGGLAVGVNANATSSNWSNVALGLDINAKSTNGGAVGVGRESEATGFNSVAIGKKAKATDSNAVGVGYEAEAIKANTVAMGRKVYANTAGSVALGSNATASNTGAIAIGGYTGNSANTTASGDNSVALGVSATADGDNSVAIGRDVTASAESAIAIGKDAVSNKKNAVALGSGSDTSSAATVQSSTTIGGKIYSWNKGVLPTTDSDGRQVSVGKSGFERQIKNVAAGEISANSTDAINGAQLYSVASGLAKDLKVSYVSINSTATGTGSNIDNDGAKGGNSIAIGPSSTVTRQNGIAIGSGAQSLSEDSVVIGRNAKAETKAGAGLTTTSRAIVIGSNSRVAADITQGIAIGSGNSPDEGAVVTGDQSIAIGGNVKVDGHSAIAIGGDDARKAANQQVSYTSTNDVEVTGTLQTAIQNLTGYNLSKYKGTEAGHAGVAYGTSALAGNAGVAIGTASDSMTRMNDKGQVVNNKPVTNAVAIGTGARANFDNSVAIGGGSNTDRYATKQVNAIIDGVEVKWSGGENISPGDIVSFGAKGFERQLKNVAPGEVSQTSTDAINGSQIYSLARKITNIMNGGAGSVVNVNASGEPLTKVVTGTGASKVERYYRTVDVEDDGTLKNGAIAQTPTSLSLVNVDQTNVNQQTQVPRTLGNVADGVKDNDAVNVSQLNAAKVKYFSVNSTVTGNRDNTGATGVNAIAIGPAATATKAQAIALGNSATAGGTDSIAIGNGSAAADKVAPVAIGQGAQANGDFSVALGGGNHQFVGAIANGVGTTALGTYSKTAADTNFQTAVGFGANTTKANATAIGYNSTVSTEGGVALGANSSSSTGRTVGYNPNDGRTNTYSALTGNVIRSTTGAVAVGNGTEVTRQITGVAAGTNDTDAVNVAQLKSVNLAFVGDSGFGDVNLANNDTTKRFAVKGDSTYLTTRANGNLITVSANKKDISVTNGTARADAGIADAKNVADAINKAVSQNAYSWNLTADNDTAGSRSTINKEGTVKFSGDQNITVKRDGNTITSSLNKSIIVDVVKANNSVTTGSGSNQITLDGTTGAVTGKTFSGQSFTAGDNVLSNTTLQIGSPTNGNNVTITKDGLSSKAGTKTAKFGANGIDAGGQQITNVSSGGNVGTNAANITDVKNAVSDVTLTLDTNSKTGTVKLSESPLKVIGANGIRTDLVGTNNGSLVVGLDSNTVNATTKGIGLTGDSGSTGLKYLKDGDATFKVAGDGNLVTTKASATGVQVAVDTAKVKDLAVDAVTVSKANTADNPITVTPTTGTNSKDYAIGIDTTKLAGKTDLTYRANNDTDANAQKVSLAKGLNFVNGDNTVATVAADGKVSYDLNTATKTKIDDSATAVARNISLGADSGTASSQSLKDGNVAFNVKGATGDYVSTNMNGNTVEISTTRATINSDTNTGAASVTGNDGLATAKNVADAINKAADAAKAGAAWNLTTNSSTTDKTSVQGGDTVDLINGDNIVITQDGTDKKKITVATKKDLTVDSVTAGNTVINTSGLTNGTTAITGSGITTDKVTVGGISIDKTDGINAGGKAISNVASGGTTDTNAANIGDVKQAVANLSQNLNITDGTNNGTVDLKNQKLNVAGANGVTATVNNQTITVGLDADTVNATTKGIGLTADTGTTGNKYLKDGDVSFAVTGDGNLVSTSATAAGVKVAVDAAKVKDLAVDAVTVSKDAQADNPITVTPTAGTNSKDYAIGIDTTKLAAKTDLTYRANNDTDANAKKVSLAKGLNFVNGTLTTASIDNDGVVKYDVNTAAITAGTDGTVTGPTTDGVATAQNVADAINAAKKASKTEITANTDEAANATTGNVILTSTTAADGHTIYDVKLNNKVTLGTGANAVTIDGTAGKATVGTAVVDGVNNTITTGGASPVTLDGATGTITGKTANIGGVTVNGTTNDITGLSNTTVTGADFATKGRAATEEQLKAVTSATALKFTGDVATNTGSINLKDDTFGIKGDGKYITTDVNGKDVNLTVSEAEIKKSAVAAVTVSTDTTDTNNPISVTPTTSADGTTKDYKVTIDGTKIANKTNLSYKANDGTAKLVSLADGLNFKNGTLTTASIDDAGVVKYDVNTATITAGTDGTVTGPTTDGVATAQNVADAINAAKKAAKTEITANTGEAANATTGNVTLTSTTAADGHTIYDVKLNDKVTLGTGANAVTIDGTAGKITAKNAAIGGVTVDGDNSHVTGLSNTTWNGTATTGRAATEDQLKAVADTAKATTDAVNLKFSGDTNTSAGVVNLKDDTFNIVGDGKYVTTDANGKDLTVKVSEAEVKKSAVAAVTVSTDTTDANNPISVTPTTSADGTTKDYKVTIDGTKIANKTNLSYKANDGTAKQVSLADGLNFKNGTLTTASIDDAGVVKYDVNTATITAGTDGTVTGPTTDGVATAQNVADAINAAKKASKTEITANTGEAANATTGNVTLTSTTAADGHTIYDVKLNDKVTLGTGANAVTIDGTAGKATVGTAVVDGVNNTITTGGANAVSLDGAAGKATIGSSVVDGVNNTITTGGANAVSLDGAAGTVTGLTNKDWTPGVTKAVTGRAATEDQLQKVADAASSQTWIITADKAGTTGTQTGTKKNATVGKDQTVELVAGDNLTINQDERKFTYSLNKDLAGLTSVSVGDGTTETIKLDGATGKVTVKNAVIGGVTVDGDNSHVTGLSNTTWNGTATTGRAATEDQLKAVSDTAKATTDAVNLKFSGDTNTSAGVVNLKDDTFNIVGDGKYVTTDANGKALTVKVSEAEVKKSAVSAVTVSTDTTDTNNPISVTPTTSADGTTKDYKVTIDGTKIANKTNLSYKANDGTAKLVSLADGLNFKNGTLTTASIDDAGVVKYDVNTATITAGTDGTVTGPTTDGVATAQNVADAINTAKKAAKTEITANTGEAANATTGNVTLTSTTAADGHTIYDVKLNDKVTLGTGANAVTIDGTAGKATIGSSVVDGVNNTITTGGTNSIKVDGATGTVTGLTNKDWTPGVTKAVTGRAATEDQLQKVADAASSQTWNITADKAGTTGAQTGTKKNATVGKDETVELVAGDNLTINQDERKFTYSLNKALAGLTSVSVGDGTTETIKLDGATGKVTAKNAVIGGVTVDGDNSHVTGLSNTTWNGTATTGRAATEDQLKAVADTAKATTDAVNLKFSGDTNTSAGVVNLKDDTFNIVGDGKYVTTDANGKDLTVKVSEAEVKKSAVAAVTVSTDTTDANNPISVTPTTSADGTTKDYKVTIDGTKIANKTNLSYKANDGTAKQVSLADGLNFKNGTLTTASIDDAGVVKYDVNTAAITAGTDGTVTGPTTDGVATAQNVADAINAAKKAAKTEITANTSEAANATTGNVTLTSTTAADGHTIYDVKLNDKVTLGSGANAVTIDGTAGKATVGTAVVDGVNNTITTGGANTITVDGAAGTVTGLTNKDWTPGVTKAVTGRAATEDQLQKVADAASSQTWNITADKAGTTGAQTGTKKNATVGKDQTVELVAGDNFTINQDERKFTYSLNKDLAGLTSVSVGDGTTETIKLDGATGKVTAKNAVIGGVTVDGDNSHVTGLSNTTWNGTATTGRAATEDQLKAVADTAKATTDAVNLKFSGDTNTSAGVVNLKDDTFNIVGDGKYVTTDANGKDLTVKVSEAEVKKSAVAAVTVSTDITDANNPISVTPTTSADGTTKDYKVTIDGTKIANKTNLSYKANDGTVKQVSLADGLNFKNGTLTTASIDDAGVVKYDINTAAITAGADGTVTGPTTDGVATAQNVADAINVAKKASKTEITANTGEAANATTGNVTLTSTTAADGHTIYDVKLNDKVTLGTGNNAVTIDGTAGKATIGSSVVDGVNNTITTGGANAVALDGAAGTVKTGTVTVTGGTTNDITGLSNTTVTSADFATKGRAATEEQLKAVGEQTWQITADKEATTSGNQTGTKKDAKVGKDDKVQLIAGENLTVNQNERDFTYSLNKDLVKMNSATFEATGGKTTVITGDSIAQTDGTKTNTSTAAGNTVADGGKSTATTADGTTVTNGADTTATTAAGTTVTNANGNTNYAADGVRINTTGKNPVSLTDAGLDNGNNVIKNVASGHVNNDDTDNINAANIADVKKATTTVTANNGEVANATTGNVTLTSTTAADGHTIYDVKLNDKVTLGTGANAVTIDGTAGKATVGTAVVDGVNNTITTGGANAVALDGAAGTVKTGTVTVTGGTTNDITGLSNTTVNSADFATKGRAATEEQLKQVGEQTWQITADKDATTSGNQTGTKKDAKVGKDDKVQLIAGENLTVNQNERDFTYSLNKDLVKMNSATFEATGGKTTVITGDSIVQTAGTQTNTSTAVGNTVADGTKSTETTAAGQVIKDGAKTNTSTVDENTLVDGAKSNKITVDSNVINDGNGNANTSNATSNTITDGTNTSTVTAGKAQIGTVGIDGVASKLTTGGANAVVINGADGTVKTGTVTLTGGTTNDITGLSNTAVNSADFATKGRAATEEQLKQVGEQTWQITADKDATTSGNQTGTKKDAKVGKDDKVQLIAGENLTVNQNERDFTFSLNKDLVKLNSATFEVTGGKTTVITGDSITQTDGTKTNTSTAASNTVADGGKSTATTADGTTVTNANGNTKYAADGVRINTTGKNPVSLTDAGLDNGNNVIKNVASGHVNNDDTDNTNAANIADVKKATTTVTANNGEAANATTGNVTLTSTTATDGHTIYDVKLNDKVTLGTGANAVTIDGTAGKATIGSSVVDGVNNTITTGGANAVVLDGAAGTVKTGTVTVTGGTTNDITGLSNTTVTSADFATKGRAATEEQLKAVGEQTWQITADKEATTSGNQTGTKKDAKVGKDDKVQLIAGENLTVNQNERDFTYSLNKDLVKMNSATLEATGGKTTVITGNSISQTDGTKTNTSTAAGNTVADGTKSTETTAAGYVIKDGAKSNKSTVDSNVIDDGNGNVNTSNATSNTITDGTNTSAITAGKAIIGSSVVDGVNNTITTGGANAVALDGVAGTVKTGTVTVTGGTTNDITGLSNTTVNSADFATKGRAATEEQLKAVGEQTWQITADKDATTSGNQTGTKKDAKVGKDDKVQLIAGENLTVNQNERDFTYSLNKDLVKMNSATFEATGGKTTVIKGDSIVQTDGTKTNISTAAGNTVADGTKSTETTAAGYVIKDGAKSNKSTVDSNVIDDGNGNVNTSNATSNTIANGTDSTATTAAGTTVTNANGNTKYAADGVRINTTGKNPVSLTDAGLDNGNNVIKNVASGHVNNDDTDNTNAANIADVKKATTTVTANNGEAANATTGNVTLTSTTATDGHTIYDVKLNDKVTLGTGANAVTIDGTAGKATIGSSVVDGVNNTITTGGANAVVLDGAAGSVKTGTVTVTGGTTNDITGLSNTTVTSADFATKGRAATEEQLKAVGEQTWQITADKEATTSGNQTGTKKDAKVGKDDKVQLIAGENLTVNQNERDFTYSLNKNLVKMNSATFEATGGKTTVITGDSIAQTDGTKTNTSTAAGNTVADGGKSTATTADGTTVTNANGNTNYAADGVRINTTGKNPVSLTDAGLDNGNNVIKNVASGHVNNDDTDNTNAANIADVKKATTTVTANNGEAANATTGNVTLTSTTAADGHTIYDVKLNDTVTLGTGANAVTIDGTAGKATIGSSVVDGVNNTITTGGSNAVKLDGAAGTVKTGTVTVTGGTTNDITGLSNTTVTSADFATKGRAATEEQLKQVGEQTWQITADKDATTSGNQTGTKKDAKVGKDDKVQLIAGENLTVNQNERDFTYSLNKDLVKMNSATFEATGGKTTVITGSSIAQTDGTKTNTSTAAGNTVADGTKSTETTAAGQVIKDGAKTNTSTVDENTLVDGAKSNKTTVDSNVIDDGNGNVNTSNATSNTITDGTNTTEATASTVTVKDNAGNSTVITKDTLTTGTGANKVTVDGNAGKVTAGSAVVDGVNNTITTGGANTVKLDGAAGTVTGLTNTAWTPGVTKAMSGRAATEDQLQQVSDAVGAGWNINSGTVAGSTGEANGSAKTKISSGEEVQLQAGNNLIIDQNGKTLSYSLNKNLKDMESAIFNATGGKTTVIKGDSIVQTDGGKTNTSNAAGNTVVDGTKSTATTAAGTTITDGAKTNTSTADKNVINDGAGNTNTSNATSNTIADPNGNTNTATATNNTLADNAGNSNVSNATSNSLTDNAGNSNVSNATSNTLKNAAGDETKVDAKGATVKDAAGNTTNVAATGTTVTNAAGDTTKVEATGTTVADAAGNKATFTKDGVTITKPGKDTVSLTGNGLDNGNNKIVNVADGTNDTDAVNVRQLDAKTKAATTELTANGGESADNTTGNIVLTKTTAPDGHIIYDNKLNDKITLGAADPTKAITVDGTNGTIKAGKDGNAVAINGTDGTIKAGDGTNAVAIDGVNGSVKVADKIALNGKDGKAAIGTVGIDGKDGIITTGGNNPVAVNGKDGVVTGLTNKTWDPNNITSGRAATEDQVQSAVANAGWDATVGTEGSGVNSTPSAIPEKIRPNETLTFKAGNNMMVSHAGKTISYAVNPDLTDMKSATFKDAAGNTTVINGNGITITPGSANPNNPNAGPVSLTKDGLNNGNNQIKGVAPGSDDTDAVNIGQLKASNAKMGDAIGQVAGEVQRVGAHAAAMAALKPIQYDPLEPTQIMAGVGNYRGETAAALGLAHYTNEDTMFNVGVSVGGNHNMVNAGVTHKFGSSPEKKNIPDRYKAGPISSVYVMQDEVSSLKKENAEQKYVIADQAARLNTLEAENERQRQELAETKQGLDDLRAAVDKLLAAKG